MRTFSKVMEYPEKSPEYYAKEGYDAQAEKYLEWTLTRAFPRESNVEKLLNALPDPSSATVLELGCGAGIPVTKTLAKQCKSVVANDISTTQLSLARKHLAEFDNVTLVENSMTSPDLEFGSAEFDAILAIYSIIHLDPAGQRAMFGRIQRWIKPGGFLLVNLAVEALPGSTTEGWLGMKAAYWSSFGQEGNKKLIEEHGFEIVSSERSQDVSDAEFGWFLARAIGKQV